MRRKSQFYVNGRWISPSDEKVIDVHCPTDGSLLAQIPRGCPEDADAAIAAAREAFEPWATTPPAQRAEALKRIQEGLKARADEIARDITLEMGMPYKLSQRIQVGSPVAIFGMYARIVGDFSFQEQVAHSKVLREPIGVVAAITPWNYPLHQIAAKVAAALAAGCTVVLKPSEVAPLNAFHLAEIIRAVGLPPGVFNLVTGYGPEIGEALVKHPGVDMVSFTGSTAAGKQIAALAAPTVKRVALELGGKSAAIVLDDADLGIAIKGVVGNCFLNSGQTCTAHTRLLVPESRYDEAARLAVATATGYRPGDPLAPETTLGPLASKAQLDRVRTYIATGVSEGAELLTGGLDLPQGVDPSGYFVAPTVFGRVKPDAKIARDEIFGPVLSMITYEDEDDAVRIANGTPYGLAGGVWSASEERAERVARRVRAGQIDINGAPFNLYAPFGGYKQSGKGRELGRYGMEEFLEFKAIQFRPPSKA